MNNLDFNFFCNNCPHTTTYREQNCFLKYRTERFQKGDYIAHRGKVARDLSMLVQGSVKTEIVFESGITYTSRIHTSPYPIGALALFARPNHYRADIIALDNCSTISVSRDNIEEQMSKCRVFMRNFLAYGTTKFDLFTSHLTILTHKNLKSRLAFYILTLTKDRKFQFDKTLDQIATYLCTERPSLSRTLRQLSDEKIISYRNGKGEIINIMAIKGLLE